MDSSAQAVLGKFEARLRLERGLAATIVQRYVRHKGVFMERLPGPTESSLEALDARQVVHFVAWNADRGYSHNYLITRHNALRCFLRFPQSWVRRSVSPGCIGSIGVVQGLDLGLLVHAEHAAFSGGARYSPTTSVTFDEFGVGGELERPAALGLHTIFPPGPRHGRVADAQPGREQPRGPMRDSVFFGGGTSVAATMSRWSTRRGRPGRS